MKQLVKHRMQRKNVWGYALLIVAVFSLGGCLADDADENGGLNEELANVIPSADSLKLEIPSASAQQEKSRRADSPAPVLAKLVGDVGQTSVFYLHTVQTTREINLAVSGLLALIDSVITQPPTSFEENRYIWGPFRPDGGLSSIEARFTVTPLTEGTYQFSLEYKSLQDENAEWVKIWDGQSAPSATPHRGQGQITLDFDAAAQLDPATLERGKLILSYDTTTDDRHIVISMEDFLDDDSHAVLATGQYTYHRYADGAGRYEFAVVGDIHADDPAKDLPEKENILIVSSWQANGVGRADVSISGGDLEEDVTSYNVIECWSASFESSYYLETVVFSDSQEFEDEEGDVDRCPEIVPGE